MPASFVSARRGNLAPQTSRLSVRAQGKAANRVELGNTGMMVSECCLGTMTYGVQNTEAEAHDQLHHAFEQGINFIDTAEMYPVPTTAETQGATDRYIASWLKDQKREDVILATKVAGYSERIDWLRDAGAPTRVSRDQILESVDASLKRLGTDHVDLLQVHWPDRYVSLFGSGPYDITQRREYVGFEETLGALQEVVNSGKVKHIGCSNETSFGVMQFCHLAETAGLPKMETIQNSYSLLVRTAFETDLTEVCHEKKVSLLAYSPLAGGVLSGKYIRGDAKENSRLNLFPGFMDRYNASLARTATAEYLKVAEKYKLSLTELSLAWCQSRPHVACSIIGATSVEQLKQNLAAFDTEFPEEALKDIDDLFKKYRDPSTSS